MYYSGVHLRHPTGTVRPYHITIPYTIFISIDTRSRIWASCCFLLPGFTRGQYELTKLSLIICLLCTPFCASQQTRQPLNRITTCTPYSDRMICLLYSALSTAMEPVKGSDHRRTQTRRYGSCFGRYRARQRYRMVLRWLYGWSSDQYCCRAQVRAVLLVQVHQIPRI